MTHDLRGLSTDELKVGQPQGSTPILLFIRDYKDGKISMLIMLNISTLARCVLILDCADIIIDAL